MMHIDPIPAATQLVNARIVVCDTTGGRSTLPCYAGQGPFDVAETLAHRLSLDNTYAAVLYHDARTPHFFAEGRRINPLDARRRALAAWSYGDQLMKRYAANG